ncbi:MAG: efflux RND transporter periplasmic adaptor subunit [Anaeromyxobacter sp.]|nr:efflux RND transporter periplasmic adaptor subunit [Anaeromyxobacter sp.]
MIRHLLPAALLLASLQPTAPRAATASPAAAPPARVHLVTLGVGASAGQVAATAVAVQRATVATRVAATVKAVHVAEGDRVSQGQLLVSLGDDDVRGALAAAEAGQAAAAAHERRLRELLAVRAATPSELELAVAQRSQAEAAVAAARATLGYTQVRAPFAASVQARRVEPGDLVGPGQPILELQGEALELTASLTEAEARGVAVGTALRFASDQASGEAVVTSLASGGDPLSHRRAVRARVRTVEGALRSGAFARLTLPGRPAAAAASAGQDVLVPRSALVERGDLTGVFVARDGRAELRLVALGEPVGALVAVRAGLKVDEAVVDAPGALRDGQAIEVLP